MNETNEKVLPADLLIDEFMNLGFMKKDSERKSETPLSCKCYFLEETSEIAQAGSPRRLFQNLEEDPLNEDGGIQMPICSADSFFKIMNYIEDKEEEEG